MFRFRHLLNLLVLPFFFSCLQARGDLGALDSLAKADTQFGPYYVLALDVSLRGVGEAELCRTYPLDSEGKLQLMVGKRPIDKIPLTGLTTDQAKEKIRLAIRRFYVVDPEVKVGVARIPRIKVTVSGATFRNGGVTLLIDARLSDALAEAGFQPRADLRHIQITRFEKDGTKTVLLPDFSRVAQGQEDGSTGFNDPRLQNGDQIDIPLNPAPIVTPLVVPQTFALMGEVRNPGFFPYKTGMTVKDALRNGTDLLPTSDMDSAMVVRTQTNNRLIINLARALQGIPTDNVPLKAEDMLFISKRDSGQVYTVTGAVVSPKTFEYKGAITLKQAIIDSGGFKNDADRRGVFLLRNYLRDPTHSQAVQIDFDQIVNGKQVDPPLLPGDMVQVMPRRKQPSVLSEIGLFLLRRFLPF